MMRLSIKYQYHYWLDMHQPSGMERQNMTHTNNTPGEAVWSSKCSTEDHQIRRGKPLKTNTIHGIWQPNFYAIMCDNIHQKIYE